LDDAAERARLAEHLGACEGCRVAQTASQEAGISYRAWLPLVPVDSPRRATTPPPAVQSAPLEVAGVAPSRYGRLLAGGLLALFLLLGFSTAVAVGTDGAPRKLFDTTGALTYPAPGIAAATPGAVSHRATKKATTSANTHAATVSESSRTATSDQGPGNPPDESQDRRRTNTGGGGNPVGGGQE